MRSRPESDGSDRVQGESHKNSDLVALTSHDLCSDRRVDEVAATEVHDLKASTLQLGDPEDILEMLVEDIEETVRETPEEEERDDQGEGKDESLSLEEARGERGGVYWYTTSHCDE